MEIYKDDPRLFDKPDDEIQPARAFNMSFWFALIRHDSDRLVNLPELRLITDTEVLWETMI